MQGSVSLSNSSKIESQLLIIPLRDKERALDWVENESFTQVLSMKVWFKAPKESLERLKV